MRPLERVPAVRKIETDRPDLFAVEITGEFSSADAENLCGLLEGAYAIHDRLDLLVRISNLDDVDLSDMSPETKDFMRDHVTMHVGRCAIVDESGWADAVTRLLKPGGSVELQRFPPQDEAQAWEWVGAREIAEQI